MPDYYRVRRNLLRPSNLPYICAYCGDPAVHKEHVFPASIYRNNTPIVWSCAECNMLAASRVFDSFQSKRDYIHDRIKHKYRKEMSLPDWEGEDLRKYGYSLRTSIKQVRRVKLWISQRLAWKTSLIALAVVKALEEAATGSDFALQNAELKGTDMRRLKLLLSIVEETRPID